MNNFQELLELYSQTNTQITFFQTVVNFLICMALSFIVRAFYINRSFSLVGKTHIASIIPILSGVVFLVIMVVKSSLALSLGLVGALSIVRFRTPIKEPEELAYIFLSIALGLCLGADQREAAMVGIPFILLIFSITSLLSNNNSKNSGKIHLTIQISNDKDHSISLKKVTSIVNEYTTSANFQRIDIQENNLLISCLLAINTIQETDVLVENLREVDPSAKISLLDDSTYPNE